MESQPQNPEFRINLENSPMAKCFAVYFGGILKVNISRHRALVRRKNTSLFNSFHLKI